MSRFWDTELISIFESKQRIIDPFPLGLVFDWEGFRYQVTLPWKLDTRPLSVCYTLHVSRLNQLYKRLRKGEISFERV